MACFKGIVSTFIMLMMIGMVTGRWLDVEPSSMISDGVDHDRSNHENPTSYLRMGSSMLYAGERCQSIYGFLPCADTMPEGVFLMIMYTYLLMLGEDWIREGSQALFLLLGDKAVGASVFQVLMALPRIVFVIVAGVLSTESAAEYQVAFGVSMYAGSTLITLTLIWGFQIILSRDKLRGKGSLPGYEHQEDAPTNNWSLKHILSILNDTGVNIDKETGDIAVIMLLSLIPFATIELVAIINSPIIILFALIVSGVSLLLYFAYQIGNPWIRHRSLAYLKQENLRTRFFYHVQRLAEDDLVDEHGNPNFKAFESVFARADVDNDGYISHDELENLIEKVFELEKDNISKEYAKAEILTHFDDDNSGMINWSEFTKGCYKWLQKWKSVAIGSNSVSTNLWKQVEKIAIRNKRADLTQIEKIMPRILKQVLEEHELVTPNGEPDREKIERLFSQYDEDSDNEIHRHELKKFIETLHFGVSLDHDTVLEEMIKDFDNDRSRTIEKHEFVEGFIKWIDRAINYDPSIKDPKDAIAKFEEDSWAEIDEPMNTVKPKASFVYVIFGILVMYLISGAFMQSILQFSNAAQIPFLLTSFVVFPIAMNARMVATALLVTHPRVSKNASLTFSQIYGGLVMNNLLGLLTLLITVYMKGLSWTYSSEVLSIMIPSAIVGLFALKRDTYPLWASILAMLLYPISIYIYYVLDS